MSNKYLKDLLVECAEMLDNLNVKALPNSRAYKTYLKIKYQLENKCETCGQLMDAQNCCMMDLENNKMYHVGCAPKKYTRPKKLTGFPSEVCRKETDQEKILGLIEKSKGMNDGAKIDLVLEIVWGLMNKK